MSDQVADVLDDAADLLEREGWIQGAATAPEGYCVEGAIEAVTGQSVALVSPRDDASDAESALRRIVGRRAYQWNDAPGRTKPEVLDAFRAAAKQERMHPGTSALADPPVGWGGPDPGRRAPTSG